LLRRAPPAGAEERGNPGTGEARIADEGVDRRPGPPTARRSSAR